MLVLRDYQDQAKQQLYEWLNNNGGNPLVVMPTGTGKGPLIAGIIRDLVSWTPDIRVLMLTHVKELIEQNAQKLELMLPELPFGVFSAGLKKKERGYNITLGGVGSVVKTIETFGLIDVLIIDEAHLIGPSASSMYQTVIGKLRALNPNLRVVGLTATDYRQGIGRLTDPHDGRIFDAVAVNQATPEWFSFFINSGYLSLLVPKRTETTLDLSSVGITAGEYNKGQLERAVDRDGITRAALAEAAVMGQDRRCWLAFCAGVDHADHVAEQLLRMGIPATSVHSNLTGEERDKRIRDFRAGRYRCITNNGVLTTGFDHPMIDFIIMLRPTLSVSLWVQMLGRGMRPSVRTNKQNCLVADFARNCMALGPVDDPVIPNKKGNGTGEIPVKICEACGMYNHLSARFCASCGAAFDIRVKFTATAGTDELLKAAGKDGRPVVELFNVMRTLYQEHESKDTGKLMLRVTYYCYGNKKFSEFVLLEHDKLALHRAHEWWRQRTATIEPPKTAREALAFTAQIKEPQKLRVWINKKPYPEIMGYEF